LTTTALWSLALLMGLNPQAQDHTKQYYKSINLKVMKSQNKILMLLITFILIIGCSKDESIESPTGTGEVEVLDPTISLDEFETDEGQIAVSISAREIAKKGYKPFTASISFGGDINLEDQDIAIDEFNNLANLSFKNEILDDEIKAKLKEGIALTVIIKDEMGMELARRDFPKLSFLANPSEQEIDSNTLEDNYKNVMLRNNIIHYMQIVDKDNNIKSAPNSELYPNTTDPDTPMKVTPIGNLDYNIDYTEDYTTFIFEEIDGEEDVFNISVHKGNDIHYLYASMGSSQLGRINIQSKLNLNANGGNTGASTFINYKFKITKAKPGLYTITSLYTGNPIVVDGNLLKSGNETVNETPAYFRILAFDIDWDIQPIDYKSLPPIMPPSTNNSEVNTTLRNCGNVLLTQGIGQSETVTTSETVSWQESMSVATTNAGSVSLSIGYEAETKFFGTGGKLSAKVTGTYNYSKTETATTTNSESFGKQKSVQVAVKREVAVPAGEAVSVIDVYQKYEYVKVPFVQRFRIYGKYQQDNSELSGKEIATQFAFNKFTGVITDVQEKFIEVTVKGNTILERLIQTSTEIRNIQNACD
tara:strand:+ start:671 stop:2437 length:1767 start_codon:yes stop_codon:yes gene_type:complete